MPGAFPHGGFSQVVLTVLRRAGKPLTTREIAARIAADYHVDASTPALMNPLVGNVRNVLGRQGAYVVASERREDDVIAWRKC